MLLAESNWLGLETLDWVVLGAYFLTIFCIGLWSLRKVHDMSDFFMGGRRFGKIFMMFFAFGAGTSSEQAVGVVAGTWRVGLAGIWWQFLWLWATPFYWIVAPVMRRMRALTTADFFEARFSGSTALLYSIYGIIMSIAFIAGGLFSSGKMVDELTNHELERVAEEVNLQVPFRQWISDESRFGRKVLFEVPAELADQVQSGTLPDEVQSAFEKQEITLPEEIEVESVAESRWVIQDAENDVTYPIRKLTVTKDEDGEKKDVEVLRVYGTGWRLVQGYEYAILAMTVLFVTYGMVGGLGAAIITDFIQGILTITFSFLLLPYVFQMIGGFGELHAEGDVKPGMFDLVASPEVAAALGKEPITIFYIVMLSLTALAGIVVQPHIMGVCGAGKTEMEGRFGFTFGNFLKRFCTIAWTFTGLACIVWYLGSNSPLQHADKPQPNTAEYQQLSEEERTKIETDRAAFADLKAVNSEDFQTLDEKEKTRVQAADNDFADRLFGRAAYDILPTIAPGLIGLLLASLLAAIMSTSDAQMVVSSGLFTENIYRKFIGKKKSQRHYLWVGRISGLIIVLMALVLQATFTDVIDALKVIIKTPAAIGISLWIGITWRGWTPAAVWVSTICAALAWAGVAYFPGKLLEWGMPESMFNSKGNMYDVWQMVSYLSAGVVSGLITSLITPRVREEKLDHFFRLIHTPVKPGEEVKSPCTLPEDPLPPAEKLFNIKDIEIGKPTWVGMGGFIAAWVCVGLIIWLTSLLARIL